MDQPPVGFTVEMGGGGSIIIVLPTGERVVVLPPRSTPPISTNPMKGLPPPLPPSSGIYLKIEEALTVDFTDPDLDLGSHVIVQDSRSPGEAEAALTQLRERLDQADRGEVTIVARLGGGDGEGR